MKINFPNIISFKSQSLDNSTNPIDNFVQKGKDGKKTYLLVNGTVTMSDNPAEQLGRSQVLHKQKTENSQTEHQENNAGYKELSDEEFAVLKQKIESNPIYIEEYRKLTLTKENIQVLNRILFNEKLYNNLKFMSNKFYVVLEVKTPEQAKLADKIFSDKRLYNNHNILNKLAYVIYSTDTQEQADVKCRIIDKILSNEKLYKNQNLEDRFGSIINLIKTNEQLEVKSGIIDKILSDEKLYNNQNVMDNLANILVCTDTFSQAKLAEKILSDVRLYDNKYLMDKVNDIIDFSKTQEQARLADIILSHEKLFNNQNFVQLADEIINYAIIPEYVEVKSKIIDKILSDEKLSNNQNVMNNIASILVVVQTQEQAKLAEKILSDEKLYNNQNFMKHAGVIVNYTTTPECSEIKCKIIGKIISDKKLYSNSNFMQYVGDIIYNTRTQEQAKFVDKIMTDERLFGNEYFVKEVSEIVRYIQMSKQAESKCVLIDKYLNNPKASNNDLIVKNLAELIYIFDENTTMKEWLDFSQVLRAAFAKKDQLKSVNSDISDEIITKKLINKNTINAISVLGVHNFEATFPSKLEGVQKIVRMVCKLKSNLTEEQLEQLLQKINPEGTKEYQKLQEEITALKKTFPQVKAGGNREALIELQNKIATKTKQAQTIRNNSCNLSPQAVLEKVKVLYTLIISDKNDVQKFLDLIKEPTKENEAIWKKEINEYIFKSLDFKFNQKVSDRLKFEQSKYICEILIGDYAFKGNFRRILQLIEDNPKKDIKEIFDELPQNKATKAMFENLGIDYDKYCTVDEKLNVNVVIKTSCDKAKKSAIKSLEKDFNDPAYLALPQEQRDKLAVALKEKAKVELKEIEKTIYIENFTMPKIQKVYRLYENGEPIKFESLKKVIRIIREELNSNDFWTTRMSDSILNNYKNTMYTHFTKDRNEQINNVKDLKEDKVANLTIRKTDMNNINHSLFLGNHGSCCTAVGSGCNQYSAPTYVKNKMVSAIEVVDGDNFVGNTMCWIAKVDGKPALILDNIELKSEYHNNDDIRDAILEYAKRMCAEIGQPDMPIYAGPHRHKLNMEVYPQDVHSMKIIGNTGSDEIYLDYITGGRSIDGTQIDKNVLLYKMR